MISTLFDWSNKVEQRQTKPNKVKQSQTRSNKVEQSRTRSNKVEQGQTKSVSLVGDLYLEIERHEVAKIVFLAIPPETTHSDILILCIIVGSDSLYHLSMIIYP